MGIFNKPMLIYGSDLPERLGKLVSNANWDAVTLYPICICFKAKKKDVPEHLFLHEFQHWAQGVLLGALLYYLVTILGYAIRGYDKALLERDAKNAEKRPMTLMQKAWIATSFDTTSFFDLFKNVKEGLIK